MDFVGLIGNRGSGKTNLMTALLKDYADAGEPVVANYKLNFPSVTMSFEDILTLITKHPERAQGLRLGIDELGRKADSYDFFRKDVRDITFLVQQCRKFGIKFLYTVQRWRNIALRLREQTDGFIMMRDLDAKNFTKPDGTRVSDHRDVCEGLFKAIFVDENMEYQNDEIFDGKPYWQFYNTYEIIW